MSASGVGSFSGFLGRHKKSRAFCRKHSAASWTRLRTVGHSGLILFSRLALVERNIPRTRSRELFFQGWAAAVECETARCRPFRRNAPKMRVVFLPQLLHACEEAFVSPKLPLESIISCDLFSPAISCAWSCEITQLFLTHRLHHLLRSALERRLRCFPRLAAKAAPAAICCFFDFAGIGRIVRMLRVLSLLRHLTTPADAA